MIRSMENGAKTKIKETHSDQKRNEIKRNETKRRDKRNKGVNEAMRIGIRIRIKHTKYAHNSSNGPC